jgi:hypothetical protein
MKVLISISNSTAFIFITLIRNSIAVLCCRYETSKRRKVCFLTNTDVEKSALTLLARDVEYVEYGVIYPVNICFCPSVQKYTKCDGNHQYSKANNLPQFGAEHWRNLSPSAVSHIGLPSKCRHPAEGKVIWRWRNYTEFCSENLLRSVH